MKHTLYTLCLLLLVSLPVFAENIGGWINQDTVFTQENSPYIVLSYLYVASGVTLTIEPGVQVLVSGASIQVDWYGFFWHGTVSNPIEPVAKMIVVHGKIVALGTEDNPIIFDTLQTESIFRWGGIHCTPNAPKSEFLYCHFKRSFMGNIDVAAPNEVGALHIDNGRIQVKNCIFETNMGGIAIDNLQEDTIICGCKFISNDLHGWHYSSGFIGVGAYLADMPEFTVARCEFTGTATDISGAGVHKLILFNKYVDFNDSSAKGTLPRTVGTVSMFGNESYNSETVFYCNTHAAQETVYCRRNKIYKPVPSGEYATIRADGPGRSYVSDNYGYGQVKFYNVVERSEIYNNILETTHIYTRAVEIWAGHHTAFDKPRIYNNLFVHYPPNGIPGGVVLYNRQASPLVFNNDFINYDSIMSGDDSSPSLYNNILYGYTNTSWVDYFDDHPPVLMNNCVSIPVPIDLDGGGNLVADPQFIDPQAGNFSLGPNSPCIDAGTVVDEMPDFDLRYHRRITPGSPGDSLAVDIGAYEFNSQYIGGLRGMVFDAISGEMIDCAKIEISLKLPEFSDTLGSFVYPTGPGVFTVHASRWDYEDQVIENVVVNEGEEILVAIPMFPAGTAIDDTTTPAIVKNTLRNYPNPFNPETTISFIASKPGRVKLKIYNLKGQLVQTLYDDSLQEGYHSFPWNGRDENGGAVSSGIYIARIEMNGEIQVHKMMLVK